MKEGIKNIVAFLGFIILLPFIIIAIILFILIGEPHERG